MDVPHGIAITIGITRGKPPEVILGPELPGSAQLRKLTSETVALRGGTKSILAGFDGYVTLGRNGILRRKNLRIEIARGGKASEPIGDSGADPEDAAPASDDSPVAEAEKKKRTARKSKPLPS